MRGFRSPGWRVVVMALSGLAGCATQTTSRSDAPGCKRVGCVEPVALAVAKPGSSVLLVGCEGAVRTERRYVLEPAGWTLRMYETGMSGPCPAAAAP